MEDRATGELALLGMGWPQLQALSQEALACRCSTLESSSPGDKQGEDPNRHISEDRGMARGKVMPPVAKHAPYVAAAAPQHLSGVHCLIPKSPRLGRAQSPSGCDKSGCLQMPRAGRRSQPQALEPSEGNRPRGCAEGPPERSSTRRAEPLQEGRGAVQISPSQVK